MFYTYLEVIKYMKNIETGKIESLKEIGQVKFALIAPVISGTYTEPSASAYYKRVAENEIDWLAGGSKRKFAWQTIKDWHCIYRKKELEGLYPKVRLDYGVSRSLSEAAQQRIVELIQEFLKITGVLIREKMIAKGIITENEVSGDTVQHYSRNQNLRHGGTPVKKERRRWECSCSCDGYEADTCHTFYIFDENGEYRKTYLIALIDNHSRLIVGARFFFNDNSANFQSVWKDAVKHYGKSKKMILDKGSTYKNKSTNYIAAKLETHLIYNPPYTPVSKALIERFFRTIKDRWLNSDSGNNYHSLNELNSQLDCWIDQYNRTIHSGLQEDPNDNHTPLQRFMYDMKDIRVLL